MSDRVPQALDFMPCRLCLGKFGNHDWRDCPTRCDDCSGYGHTLGANHPAGHIDSHQHLYHDALKDSICQTCNGSGVAPRFQQEILLYRQQLEQILAKTPLQETT